MAILPFHKQDSLWNTPEKELIRKRGCYSATSNLRALISHTISCNTVMSLYRIHRWSAESVLVKLCGHEWQQSTTNPVVCQNTPFSTLWPVLISVLLLICTRKHNVLFCWVGPWTILHLLKWVVLLKLSHTIRWLLKQHLHPPLLHQLKHNVLGLLLLSDALAGHDQCRSFFFHMKRGSSHDCWTGIVLQYGTYSKVV